MPRKSKHYSPTNTNKTKEFHKSTTNFEQDSSEPLETLTL